MQRARSVCISRSRSSSHLIKFAGRLTVRLLARPTESRRLNNRRRSRSLCTLECVDGGGGSGGGDSDGGGDGGGSEQISR